MDRTSRQSDVKVYCHECQNEWIKDNHGLVCPSCSSTFVEEIEAGHDPRRHDTLESGIAEQVPDPDEDDISNLLWDSDHPDGTSFTYTNNGGGDTQARSRQRAQQESQQGQPALNSILHGLANVVGNILGEGRPPGSPQQETPGRSSQRNDPFRMSININGQQYNMLDGREQPRPHQPGMAGYHTENPERHRTSGSPSQTPPGRSNSAPGLPRAEGIRIRSGEGPGFRWQVTTSHGPSHTHATFGDPFEDTFFRAGNSDPFATHRILFGGRAWDPHGMHGYHYTNFPPVMHGNHYTDIGAMAPFFAGILGPRMAGDAVYSQEHLDQIITQLMEQNASGNAPGPATDEAINSLPKRAINEKDLGSEGKAECSICMEEVNFGEQVTDLPCHHWFHGDCIKAWLTEHDTCPHCRQGIMPRDGPENSSRSRNPEEAPQHDQMWGQGTQGDPWVIPDSPQQERSGGQRRRSSTSRGSTSRQSAGESLFNRMRNAFGGGGGGAW